MHALLTRIYKRVCGSSEVDSGTLMTSWPELDYYVRKLHVLENAEENSIMLHSVSSTPHANTPNCIPTEDINKSISKSSRKSVLMQIFTDFERLCRAFPAFIRTARKDDIQTISTAISAINCMVDKEH